MNEALIGPILIAIILIVALMILVSCIKIVPQATFDTFSIAFSPKITRWKPVLFVSEMSCF